MRLPHISSIRLINFLSHQNTTLKLKLGFNLLVGKNGTGKTAFIQAIDFLVSGRKNRYSRWEHYITDGENSASVIMTIESNNGSCQFERRIERKTSGSIRSSYYMNGKRTKLTQIRKKMISLGFNILNPLIIVRQTNIARLMLELNSQTVLEAIEELSGISELRTRVEKISESIGKTKDRLKDLKLKKERLKWKTKRLEDEKRLFQRYETVNKEIHCLTADENYYKIKELEENSKKIKEHLLDIEHNIDSLRTRLENVTKRQQLINDNLNDIKSFKSILQSEDHVIQTKMGKIGGKESILQAEVRKALINSKYDFNLEMLPDLIEEFSLEIEQIENEIHNFEEEKSSNLVSDIDIEKFKSLMEQKKTVLENLDENLLNLLNEVRKLNEIEIDIEINNPFAEIDPLNSEDLLQWLKKDKKTDLDSMKKDIIDLSSYYQAWLSKINDGLEEKKLQIADLEKKVAKYKKEGKSASLPIEVATIKNHIMNEKIDAIGPICHHVKFKRKEFETAARFMVPEQVWYSFIALNKTARQHIRELRGNSKKFRIVLQKSQRNIVQEHGEKSSLGRLIDGIDADSVIKGYLYEIFGDVQVTNSQEEADWSMSNGMSAITLEGVYCKPSRHYETDIKRYMSKVNLTSEDTRRIIQDSRKEIKELQEEKKKKSTDKRKTENACKGLEKFRSIVERIIPIFEKVKAQMDEVETIQNEINSLDSSIEKYLHIKSKIEEHSVKKQTLLPKLEEMETIQNLQDQLKTEKEKAKELAMSLENVREKLTISNQQHSEGQHKVQTLIEFEKTAQTQIEELLSRQSQYKAEVQQINTQIEDLRCTASNSPPKLTKQETQSNLDKLYHERAAIGSPDPKVFKKLKTEIRNLKKLHSQTKQEENNVEKLEEKIKDTIKEWKAIIQDMVSQAERGIQSILKDEEIVVRLSFQSKGKGVKSFNESTVEIEARKKSSSMINISGMSPGERSLIGMALLLGMQEVLPKGGIRILDEFDENLDRSNTIYIRDKIRDRTTQAQYLVLTPGKFPELGVGANIIRIQRELNETKIWHGWPDKKQAVIEG